MTKEEKAEELAEKVKTLFGFCATFIPDIEILKEAMLGAHKKEDFTLSAAPILGAIGVDYEQKNWEWRMKRERAEALVNLIETLDRTEKERIEMNKKQASMADVLKAMGI